jgi:hypothetical protein
MFILTKVHHMNELNCYWLINLASNLKGLNQIWWTHEERHGIIWVVDVEGKTRFSFQ